LEYAIHHVVEERLDLSNFDERYSNDETGRKAIDPKVLIKIVYLSDEREVFLIHLNPNYFSNQN
jgi:transposase